MKNITYKMYNKYNMSDIDWLGYEIYTPETLDAHHIIKKSDGGRYEMDNIAVLNNYDHKYLHIVENKDLEMYIYLNNLLKVVNDQQHMSTLNQLLAINDILNQFEREHSGDTNSKGQPLIKEEYTRRLIRKI